MELVGKPQHKTVSDVIKSLKADDIDDIWIATAYLNRNGFRHIKDMIAKASKTKIIVCLDPKVTDWEPLDEIISMRSVECKYYKPDPTSYFHPKMYIFKKKRGKYSLLLGSSNLTHGGLTDNIEANLYYNNLNLSGAKDFINFFDKAFKKAIPLIATDIATFKESRNKYIEHQRKWQSTIQKTKSKKFFPPSLERKLTSSQTDRIKRLIKREKGEYVKWFKDKNHCSERADHINKIKAYSSKGHWVDLFDEIWSVGGLRRGALARSKAFIRRYGKGAFKTHHDISSCLVDINGTSSIASWIGYIQDKDLEKAGSLPLHGISEKIQSELFCAFYGDDFGIKNDKSIRGFKYIIGDPYNNFSYKSYDSMPYSYFNSLLKETAQTYLDVIGRLCPSIPLLLELDAFFWYLYENKIS